MVSFQMHSIIIINETNVYFSIMDWESKIRFALNKTKLFWWQEYRLLSQNFTYLGAPLIFPLLIVHFALAEKNTKLTYMLSTIKYMFWPNRYQKILYAAKGLFPKCMSRSCTT